MANTQSSNSVGASVEFAVSKQPVVFVRLPESACNPAVYGKGQEMLLQMITSGLT